MARQERWSHLSAAWKDFNRALRSAKDEFNPFIWIYRLCVAAGCDICALSPIPWRPCVPLFGVTLIVLVATCFYAKLRTEVIGPRWCHNESSQETSSCLWMKVHSGFIVYFTVMILYHFITAALLSPGVLVTERDRSNRASGWWKFWKKPVDTAAEQKLVNLYRKAELDTTSDETAQKKGSIHYHPDPYPSYCKKCETVRPPRCHHCSVRKRCVLQFDHHCVWLDNAIGYNNARSFILVLFYLVTGCWYGILLLYKPFYEPLQAQLRQYGGLLPYVQLYWSKNATNEMTLFDIPSLTDLTTMLVSKDQAFPVQAIVDVVFPLLLGVGAILAIFLGTHVKYILTARTTLEHRVVLDHQLALLTSATPSTSKLFALTTKLDNKWINSYDQGPYRNWVQIMGSNWLYLFLPIPIAPTPPYIPNTSKKNG